MTLLAQHQHAHVSEWCPDNARVTGVRASIDVLADDRRDVWGYRTDVAGFAVLRVGLLACRRIRNLAGRKLCAGRNRHARLVARRRMGVEGIHVASAEERNRRRKNQCHRLHDTHSIWPLEGRTHLCPRTAKSKGGVVRASSQEPMVDDLAVMTRFYHEPRGGQVQVHKARPMM
jgi:hypothetical protein